MRINLDPESILSSLTDLKGLGDKAFEATNRLSMSQINNAFSAQSDYSHMGGERGKFINGGAGSASEVIREFTKQIDWIHENLSRNADALFGQEGFNKRWLDISDVGGSAGGELVGTRPRPKAVYNNIMMHLPLMLPEEPHMVNAKMMMSQDSQAVMAGQQWAELAVKVGQISMGLTSIANQIEAANEGAVIEQMIPVFREVAEQGSNFAINAVSMAEDLGKLVSSRHRVHANVQKAVLEIDAAPTPALKAALTGAKTAEIAMQLRGEMSGLYPSVKNLMGAPATGVSLAQAIEIGQDLVSGNGKLSTEGLGAVGPGITRIAQMMTGDGNFGEVQQGATNYGGRSATDVATHATSVGSPTLAGASTAPAIAGGGISPATTAATVGAPASLQTAPGIGTSIAGGAPIGAAGNAAGATNGGRGMGMVPGMPMMAGSAPATNAGAGTSRATGVGTAGGRTSGTALNSPGAAGQAGAGRGGFAGVPGVAGMGSAGRGGFAGTAGAAGATGAAGVGGATRGGFAGASGVAGMGGAGRGGFAGAPGVAGMGSAGRGSFAGSGGMNPGGFGTRGGMPVGGPGAALASGGAGAQGAGPAAGGRAGSPMMGGMPMGAAGGKRDGHGKVKRITSAVESDENLESLLGQRQGVVPGVIGAWVRD